ncbi:MAG: DUF4340 domain-containing protein [Candidatus Gastranaerophilales bacterium]|nr:DUF4340 domain-containing protein [Candidatus Gastranaerophilales bacterium]
MRKQSRQFVILLLVLLVLAAAGWGLRQYYIGQSQKGREISYVFDLDRSSIAEIGYDYQGEHYSFVKEDGVWYYEGDRTLALTQGSVESMATTIASMEILQTIEGVEDMEQYGLGEERRTLDCRTDEGEYVLYMGNFNETTQIFYVCRPEENKVYVVSNQVMHCFSRTPEDLKSSAG